MEDASAERSRVVVLVSDANTSTFTHNTPWHFSNVFPSPLTDRSDRRFTLRVCSVVVNGSLLAAYRRHARLIINISGVEPQAEGRYYSQRSCAFPVAEVAAKYAPDLSADILSTRYHEHVFRQSPRLPLQFQILTQLSITITTENGELAEVAGGEKAFPTIIMLELEEEEQDLRQFTVTCNSTSHDGLYAANELATFTSPLPTEVELKDYEVGLQSIVYPPWLRERMDPFTLSINGLFFDFSALDMEDTPAFLNALTTSMRVHRDLDSLSFRIRDDDGSVELHRMNREQERQLPALPAGRQRRAMAIYVTCSFNFLVAIAGPGGKTVQHGTILRPGETIQFGGRPNISRLAPFSVSMLECDIVSPNVVGGRRGQLLQVVPVLHDKMPSASRLYEPAEILFQPVEAFPFNQIRLKFTHPNGSQRHFYVLHAPRPAEVQIVLTLIFRKRTMYR